LHLKGILELLKCFIKQLKIKILAPKRTHYTRANPDPNPATIVDDPKRILRKPKGVETQGSSIQLIQENSLPKELSSLEDIQFDLSFELSLFRTCYHPNFFKKTSLCQLFFWS